MKLRLQNNKTKQNKKKNKQEASQRQIQTDCDKERNVVGFGAAPQYKVSGSD